MFDQTRDVLHSVTLKEFKDIRPEYPISNRPEHSSIKYEELGVAFGIDCAFCRTRYVYAPGYTQLPPDIEGEIKYRVINENWFRVDQDWN